MLPAASFPPTPGKCAGEGVHPRLCPQSENPLPYSFKPMEPLDADQIIPNLWMGSAPPSGESVANHGFTVLVLCAEEFQPEEENFAGLKEVIYAGIDDTEEIPSSLFETAEKAADRVAHHVRGGGKVLVTCWAGLNRSGLVTAWAIHKLNGWSGEDCIRVVKSARSPERKWDPYALKPLHNKAFNRKLLELK